MNDNKFDDFVNNNKKKDSKTINWENKLERWKNFIDNLYSNIDIWLKEYTENQRIEIKLKEIEIFEEAIGKYIVKSMEIIIGENSVLLKPIGTVLIGTIGRVDVIGKKRTQKLILADKNATSPKITSFTSFTDEEKKANDEKIKKIANTPVDWEWKMASNPPKIKYSELNKKSFFNCLIEVTNG